MKVYVQVTGIWLTVNEHYGYDVDGGLHNGNSH